jgi:hypothetical protein
MVGLLLLKQLENLSDERVVLQFKLQTGCVWKVCVAIL